MIHYKYFKNENFFQLSIINSLGLGPVLYKGTGQLSIFAKNPSATLLKKTMCKKTMCD